MLAAADHFADDVTFHIPGQNPLAGEIHGKDQWLASLSKYVQMEQSGTALKFEVHDVIGGDDHVIALLSVRADRREESLDWHRVAVYHVHDGKIKEVWIHDVDQREVDDFFSG